MLERYSLIRANSFSVPICSEMEVKPAISEKKIATSCFRPQRMSSSGLFERLATTSGAI